MKKLSVVAVAVCLFAGSSFAAWDYFPPKEAGKGQARLNFEYKIPGEKLSEMDLAVKGRYSIIEGLEAALSLPVPLSSSYDGTSDDGFAGLSIPEIGVRYWLPFGLGFYLDFGLPVDTRYDKENLAKVEYEPRMKLGVGAQFSTKFTDELSLGSQLGLNVPFAGADSKVAEGMGLVVGAEIDYAVSAFTGFLGAELAAGLTPATSDGKTITDFAGNDVDPAKAGLDLWIGGAYGITENFGADLYVKFGLLEGKGGPDNTPITIGIDIDFNF